MPVERAQNARPSTTSGIASVFPATLVMPCWVAFKFSTAAPTANARPEQSAATVACAHQFAAVLATA
jgi:hypothetical protein